MYTVCIHIDRQVLFNTIDSLFEQRTAGDNEHKWQFIKSRCVAVVAVGGRLGSAHPPMLVYTGGLITGMTSNVTQDARVMCVGVNVCGLGALARHALTYAR